jgi:hypothetical protein
LYHTTVLKKNHVLFFTGDEFFSSARKAAPEPLSDSSNENYAIFAFG